MTTLPFDVIRSEYSNRLEKLEKDILSLCRTLKFADITRHVEEPELFECEKTDHYLRWHFDMREFPIHNITLEVKDDRCVKLYAHRRLNKQTSEMIKRFVLPDEVEPKLSATLRSNGILIIEAPLKKGPS